MFFHLEFFRNVSCKMMIFSLLIIIKISRLVEENAGNDFVLVICTTVKPVLTAPVYIGHL